MYMRNKKFNNKILLRPFNSSKLSSISVISPENSSCSFEGSCVLEHIKADYNNFLVSNEWNF